MRPKTDNLSIMSQSHFVTFSLFSVLTRSNQKCNPIFHCVQLCFTLSLKEGIIARGSYTLRRRRRVITRFITVSFDHYLSPVLFIYLCIVFVGGGRGPRSIRFCHNKIYLTPPTPPPHWKLNGSPFSVVSPL